MLSIHLELEDCFVDGKVGWRPLSYPSADPHFDRHTNYCEDDHDQHCEIEDYFVDGDGVNTHLG